MKIIVRSAAKQGDNLAVTINHDFHTTPEGRRALRILYVHAYSGYSCSGTSIRLNRGGNVAAINTTAACQSEMDRLANKPIKLRFMPVRVGSTQTPEKITDLLALRQTQVRGNQCWAQMKFKSNLPILSQDERTLEKLLGCPVYRSKDDIYSAAVVMYLVGHRANDNPWRSLKDFRPIIIASIK